jgi:hypothetical protein
MSQPKWKKANYSSTQVKDTSLSAKTGTIKKLRSTDIDVSTIHGSNSIGVSTNIDDTSYNTSKYSALTISAEAIQYRGGGKPENITVGGTTYEQYIQPLIFENKSGIAEIKARGALAHISEISNEDITTPLNAFGLFSAPNENLILTVAQDNGIFDYIDGSKSNSLSYTKTGIFIDKSNRIFMGISGEDLTADRLDYLVKGNPEAQLYVKGDIVVDGSGVQIDKYIVDDILVGESVAIMGNSLSGEMVNDISAAVPNLEKTLYDKEAHTSKQGYLMVANNTYLYSDLIFPTSDVSNSSADKITGSIQFHGPKTNDDPDGETICSISAFNDNKLLDISGSDKINMHSTKNIDISSETIQMYGIDISMQSTNNINMQSINNIDISSETIQMYGSDISMQSTDNINMQSTDNIDISSGNIQLNVSFPPPSDGGFVSTTPISNSITYSRSSNKDMALAIFNVGEGNTPAAYTDLLNEPDSSMAIPTVDYVARKTFWSIAASDTKWQEGEDRETDVGAWLMPKNSGTEENVYIPGDLAVEGEIKAGTIYGSITADNMTVTNTFQTTCNEIDLFWGLLDIKYHCTTSSTEQVNFTVEATSNFQKSIRARHSPNTSVDGEEINQFSFPYSMMNSAGVIVNPESMKNDAVISMIGNRNIPYNSDQPLYPTQILFGNFYDGSSSTTDPSGISFLGGIRTSIIEPSGGGIVSVAIDADGKSEDVDGTASVGKIEFCGSNNGTELVPFMTYNGDTGDLTLKAGNNNSGNIIVEGNDYTIISKGNEGVSFLLDDSGHIKKEYLSGNPAFSTATDPSNSLVDLSFVLNHVSDNATYWKTDPNHTNAIQPKDTAITTVKAVTFHATSDVVKKENIQTISGALESIDELRGVSYNLKTDETKKTHHGVIAQEIEKIFPDMVAGEEGNKSVAYMEIIGVLVEAVKDLKKRVEELENK